MIQFKKLALAGAITASLMGSTSASASSTMYNMFKPANATTSTDGWVYGFNGALPQGTRGGSAANPISPVNFVGTASATTTPFGYSGNSHLNWAVQLTGSGDSAEISAADSLTHSAVAAEIDTGGGAWQDNEAIPQGWKHQTDIGLIRSDVTQNVRINLETLGGVFSRFGVTVFEGMDTNTGNYSHHGAWNKPTDGRPFTQDNPFGTIGLDNIKYSDNVTGSNYIEFFAEANKIYTVYLGGYQAAFWNAGVDGYVANISTAPVPVPGAVWLFGSAMAGMVGFGRRKAAVAA
jgi:hypothetical protein